jgi:hypothetical protein
MSQVWGGDGSQRSQLASSSGVGAPSAENPTGHGIEKRWGRRHQFNGTLITQIIARKNQYILNSIVIVLWNYCQEVIFYS